MRSSDKRRGALGQWATVIMMALVLAFLVGVAPVSGAKYCSDTCGKKIKDTDPGDVTRWHEHKETKICKTAKGTKYLIQDRDCAKGIYIRMCHDRVYCTQTKACAEIGPAYEKKAGSWKECDPWDKYFDYR